MNFLQRDAESPELTDNEQGENLLLRIVTVVAFVFSVIRNQKADLVIISQSFNGDGAQGGNFADGIIVFAVRHVAISFLLKYHNGKMSFLKYIIIKMTTSTGKMAEMKGSRSGMWGKR
jgi:hypothetical protein